MPRKKPDAIVALDAVIPVKPACARCSNPAFVREGDENLCLDCYVAAANERAQSALDDAGLTRQPGESPTAHRSRMFAWIKARAKLKTFADAATKAEDEWSA